MAPQKELFDRVTELEERVRGQEFLLKNKDEKLAFYAEESERLHEIIRDFKRNRFGVKSERWESEEQLVFNEVETLSLNPKPDEYEDDIEGAAKDVAAVKAHTRVRGKRKALPTDLPREIVVIELPLDQQVDSEGRRLKPIGKEISEKLYFEPSKLLVQENHRIIYGYESGDAVITAPVPSSMLPKSYSTSGLLAHIAMQKYGYGLPLYRLEDMFKRMGMSIPRCTQARWVIEAAEKCRPLWNLLEERLMQSNYVSCDETWTQVLKEKNKTAESKSWMWVRTTPADAKKIVLFDYDPHRTAEVAKRLFADYKGTLQTDGLASYNTVEAQAGVLRIGCNMHGRRRFEAANKIGAKA